MDNKKKTGEKEGDSKNKHNLSQRKNKLKTKDLIVRFR